MGRRDVMEGEKEEGTRQRRREEGGKEGGKEEEGERKHKHIIC